MSKSNKRSRREEARKQKGLQRRNRIIRNIALGLVPIIFIIGFVFVSQQRPDPATALSDLELVDVSNIDGRVDAPVIITEFGDFGCPACRQWHRSGIKAQIQRTFGDDVTFVFRHFPIITRQSPQAAEASQCAAEQGNFWGYHDYVYEQGDGLSVEQLVSYAGAVGLDATAFETCLTEGRYEDYVDAEMRLARQVGARGTPTFLVNDQLIAAPSFAILADAIRNELQ